MPQTQAPFNLGDRVIHATKPDWGTGHVLSAKADPENGPESQKLQVRFQHAGMKTLCTAYAALRSISENGGAVPAAVPAVASSDPPRSTAASNRAAMDLGENPEVAMSALPDAATDPFATAPQRLAATLDLYRFTGEGGSLIEWATLQSGLVDPLTRFSRHDLEEFFSRYATMRDRQLAKVSQENMKSDPKALAPIVSAAPPAAREALRRINRRS